MFTYYAILKVFHAGQRNISIYPSNAFDSLSELRQVYIEECPMLTSIQTGKDSLSELRQVYIEECPMLTNIQTGKDGLLELRLIYHNLK